MIKVLIFGGGGLIGSRIRQLLAFKYKIIAPSHQEIDIVDQKQVEQIIRTSKPDYIINAAGLTSLDKAEEYPKLAYLLNTQAPAFIAKFAASFNIPLLHFSTDAVFDGRKKSAPYKEDDNPNPISVYGESKLKGEKKVIQASKKNCIVRVISVYSASPNQRQRFVQKVIDILKKREKFYGLTDQVINPIYVDDIVWAVDLLIKDKSSGIYHLGAKDYLTNYEFIKKLAKTFNLDQSLVLGMSLSEFSKDKSAPRNKFCWLDTSKFRREFGDNILHTTDEGLNLLKKNLDL